MTTLNIDGCYKSFLKEYLAYSEEEAKAYARYDAEIATRGTGFIIEEVESLTDLSRVCFHA